MIRIAPWLKRTPWREDGNVDARQFRLFFEHVEGNLLNLHDALLADSILTMNMREAIEPTV